MFWIRSDPEIFVFVKIVLDYMYNILEGLRKSLAAVLYVHLKFVLFYLALFKAVLESDQEWPKW